MRALYREQIFKAGKYMTVSVFPVFGRGRQRRGRYKPTSDVQQRLNEFNAREHAARLLHANFTENDVWLHLTYDEKHLPETREQLMRDFNNFKRRLIRYRTKKGLPELRYVAIAEGDDARYHVHMVMDGDLTAGELKKLWGKGFIRVDPLVMGDFGLEGLANYILKGKEVSRLLRSRNLVDPQPTERTGALSKKKADEILEAFDDPHVFDGLYEGYRITAAKPFYNWFNRHLYLRIYAVRE